MFQTSLFMIVSMKWSIVPGPTHQNNTLLSQVFLPKTDRTVCAGSFILRPDKFVILGGSREVFYALTRCYFNCGTEGKVSPRGADCRVKHRGVNVFCLLILHVTTTRHDKLTTEIYCGIYCKRIRFAFISIDHHSSKEASTCSRGSVVQYHEKSKASWQPQVNYSQSIYVYGCQLTEANFHLIVIGKVILYTGSTLLIQA